MTTIEILDIAGTFVFAVAGAFRATRHHLDLLGIMVLAVATGVGGGMIRDMLLGATPVAAIQSELYLGVCLAGGVVRDMLVREIPAVIRHDFYATAALLGGATLLGADAIGLSGTWQIVSAAIVTSGLRFFAMTRNVGLPRAKVVGQED